MIFSVFPRRDLRGRRGNQRLCWLRKRLTCWQWAQQRAPFSFTAQLKGLCTVPWWVGGSCTVNYTRSRLTCCVFRSDFVIILATVVWQDGGHSGGVNTVQWHPEGCLLYSGSDDTYIAEWDLQTGKTRRSAFSFCTLNLQHIVLIIIISIII